MVKKTAKEVMGQYEQTALYLKVITLGFDFKEAYICDLMENNIEKLAAIGRSVSIKLKNYEIVTLKFII